MGSFITALKQPASIAVPPVNRSYRKEKTSFSLIPEKKPRKQVSAPAKDADRILSIMTLPKNYRRKQRSY